MAPLAWPLMVIVALKGFWGIDAYHLFGITYWVMNLLFGLAMIPIGIGVARKCQEQLFHSPFLQRVVRDIAGKSLNEATDFLTSLAEFSDKSAHN